MLTIKNRKKRSKIWLLPDDDFIKLIKNSTSVKVALAHFNMENKGNNFKTIKSRINQMNIDISHFLNNVDASSLSRKLSKEEFMDTWLIKNSDKNRFNLKNYLVKFDLINYRCAKCSNTGSWLGEAISLQLEHINGISNDNRLENLCFLCPNCHSQTDSYAGKKNKKHYYCQCGEEISKISNICLKCNGLKNRKIDWPSEEILKKMLWDMPTTRIAEHLGVTDKAVEKHIKSLGLDKPPRGYWSKKRAEAVGIEP